MRTEVIRCPHCHLEVTLGQRGKEPSIDYDVEEWRKRCRYPELGGAGWCIVRKENNGTPPRKSDPIGKN
jgi:hypothetical protein